MTGATVASPAMALSVLQGPVEVGVGHCGGDHPIEVDHLEAEDVAVGVKLVATRAPADGGSSHTIIVAALALRSGDPGRDPRSERTAARVACQSICQSTVAGRGPQRVRARARRAS